MSNLTQAMEQSARLVGMFQSVIDLHSAIADVAGIEQVKGELVLATEKLRADKDAAEQDLAEVLAAASCAEDAAAKLITDAQIAAAQIVADAKSTVEIAHAHERSQHKAAVSKFDAKIEAMRDTLEELTAKAAAAEDRVVKAEDRVATAEAQLATIRASIGA